MNNHVSNNPMSPSYQEPKKKRWNVYLIIILTLLSFSLFIYIVNNKYSEDIETKTNDAFIQGVVYQESQIARALATCEQVSLRYNETITIDALSVLCVQQALQRQAQAVQDG